uniref:Uncharacterized protein n=1 Tax=Leptobrachium leishanense TaxID=445787 RepID=A0A8C5LMI0_9ANUR
MPLPFSSRSGVPGNFLSCCTQLAKRVPKNMLPQVTRVQFQKNDGICHLQAIVVTVSAWFFIRVRVTVSAWFLLLGLQFLLGFLLGLVLQFLLGFYY